MNVLLEVLEARDLPSVPTTGAINLNPDHVVYVVSSLVQDLVMPSANQDVIAALSIWAGVVPINFKETSISVDPNTLPDPVIIVRGDTLTDNTSNIVANATTPSDSHTETIQVFDTAVGDDFLTRILLHEFGHTLGLLHETDPAAPSVMHPILEDDAPTPTADDLAAVQSLYGAGTGTVSTFGGTPLSSPNGIGVYDPGTATWYLRDSPSPGAATSFRYGAPGWLPVVGDWNGDGKDGVGVYDPSTSTFYLRNEASPGAPDAGVFRFGNPREKPVVGDWDGTGFTKMGVFDPSTGNWDLAIVGGVKHVPSYGGPMATPLSFKFDGVYFPSIYDPSGLWYPPFRSPVAETPDYKALIGNWLGVGTYDLGLVDPVWETWFLPGMNSFQFGAPAWDPLAGYWNQ